VYERESVGEREQSGSEVRTRRLDGRKAGKGRRSARALARARSIVEIEAKQESS